MSVPSPIPTKRTVVLSLKVVMSADRTRKEVLSGKVETMESSGDAEVVDSKTSSCVVHRPAAMMILSVPGTV